MTQRTLVITASTIVGLIIVILIGVFAFGAGKKPVAATPSPSPVIPEKVNTMPVEKRPYLTLTPTNKGRSLILSLFTLNTPVKKAEFEVEYQSGTLLQGFGGKLNTDKLPDVQEFLLGSCSAGGKCSYSEDVTGGVLTVRLTDTEKLTLKNEWSFLENTEKTDTITSRDGKFVMTGKGIAAVTHLVVLQSPGYPAPVAAPLSNVYAPAGLTTPKGELKVSIRLNADAAKATIWGWDGKVYKALKTTVADKVASATSTTFYQSYVAVAE
jgi:hypothetical protein